MRRLAGVWVAFWLVSGLFLGIGTSAANPAEDGEAAFARRIGDERSAAGLASYTWAPDLVDVARRHAEEMRRQQDLHHNPRLGEDVQGWQSVGENVGVGSSVEAIHQELMKSQSHRDNILSPRFTEVGVGVVVDERGDLWVVQVFRLPRSQPSAASEPSSEPAPPEPEPRPSTPPPPPPPATGSGGEGVVRAAAVTATTAAPATTAPAPPSTAPTAPPSTVATTPVDVPTTLASPATTTAAGAATVSDPSPSTVRAPAPTSPGDRGGASPRQVTWPVGLAAGMLLAVVMGLVVQVAGSRVRAVAGTRPSLLDVWELALAR